MTRLRGVGLVVFVVLYCIAVAVVFPGWRDRVLAIATVIVLAFFAVVVVRRAIASTNRTRSPFDEVMTPRVPRAERPPDLVRIESALGWKSYTPLEFGHRAGPLLRELAAYRLKASGLADLDNSPQAARPHLSKELWEVVTSPGATRDQSPHGSGGGSEQIYTRDIAAMIEEIESL